MEEEIHHQCPYKYSPASLHHYASQYVVELRAFARPWPKTEKRTANQRKMPVHPWYSKKQWAGYIAKYFKVEQR